MKTASKKMYGSVINFITVHRVYSMIHTQIRALKVVAVLVFWVVEVVMGKLLAREFVVCHQILFCTVQNEYLLACASDCRADKWPIQ